MKRIFQGRSAFANLQKIAACRNLDLQNASSERIERHLRSLLSNFPIIFPTIRFDYAFRTRKNKDSLFDNYRRIWYPNPDESKMGRFNKTHQPLFYISNSPNTAIFECRPNKGDLVTLLKISARDNFASIKGAAIGLTRALSRHAVDFNENGALRNSIELKKLIGRRGFNRFLQVDAFLEHLVTEDVSEENTYKYRLTNLLAEILFEKKIGLIEYPSIAANYNGLNFAILPKIADEKLIPESLLVLEIIGSGNDGRHYYATNPKWISTEIKLDGNIVWKKVGDGINAQAWLEAGMPSEWNFLTSS